MRQLLLFYCVLFSVIATAQNSITNNFWYNSGYQGNKSISNVATVNVKEYGAVGDGISDDHAAIQNAIVSLKGKKGVIYLPAGNYKIAKSLAMRDSVIFKGASADLTTLTLDFKGNQGDGITLTGGAASKSLKILSGLHKGSEFLVTEHDHGISAGDYIEIRQLNGSWNTNPASWAEYAIGTIVKVKKVSSNKVFLDEPLDIDLDVRLKPEFLKVRLAKEVHIECLTITRRDQEKNKDGYNILFRYAINSTVSGIVSDKSFGSHIMIENSRNISVSNSYFTDAYEFTGTSTRGYGVTLRAHAEKNLIENNIFKKLRHAMVVKEGAFHNIISYNYSIEPKRSEYPYNFSGDISLHGHYPFENLFEGNIVQNIIIDHYWGPSGPGNTFYRNRAELYGIIITNGNVTTNEQIFIYNEITNSDLFYGKFITLGDNHYRYGNNVNGSLETIDKKRTIRNTRYLTEKPDWWIDKMPWASIGYPNAINQHSNPARERYHQQKYAICTPSEKINYTFNTLAEEELQLSIYPNPVKEKIDIKVETDDIFSDMMNVKIFNMVGKLVYDEELPVTSNITNGNILLPATLATGTYLMRVECDGRVTTKKFFRQ